MRSSTFIAPLRGFGRESSWIAIPRSRQGLLPADLRACEPATDATDD